MMVLVPAPSEFNEIDRKTLAELAAYPAVIGSSIEKYRFRESQTELMNLARLGNKYLADEEPWKTIKTDEARTKTVMFVALQIATALASLSEPLLPFTSSKLKRILNLDQDLNLYKKSDEPFNNLEGDGISMKVRKTKREMPLLAGHIINKSELLFSKIEDDQIQKQLDKLEASKAANEAEAAAENTAVASQKETINFDDFTKLDMRVGTIIEAEKMAKTKKLLILKVDTGIDTRTIVSGIAESFTPEEVVGKQVTVLVNLAPRALRGVESEGMILMTEDAQGKLVFLNPDVDGVGNGKVIS